MIGSHGDGVVVAVLMGHRAFVRRIFVNVGFVDYWDVGFVDHNDRFGLRYVCFFYRNDRLRFNICFNGHHWTFVFSPRNTRHEAGFGQ